MRTLLLLLLLLNLVFFAWSQGWMSAAGLGPATQTEPQRLALQVHPDRVRVTPLAAPASAASGPGIPQSAARQARDAASAPAMPASAPSQAPAAAGSSPAAPKQAASVASGKAVCRQIGPFGAMETAALTQAQAALKAASLTPQAIKSPVPPQWMVWLGPYPNRAAMQAQLDQLAQSKVKVYAPVVDRPRYEPGISLGVFPSQSLAQEQLQMVHRQGVQDASVVPRNAGLERTVLRLPALAPAQVATLNAIAGKLDGQTVKACEP